MRGSTVWMVGSRMIFVQEKRQFFAESVVADIGRSAGNCGLEDLSLDFLRQGGPAFDEGGSKCPFQIASLAHGIRVRHGNLRGVSC